MADTIEVADAPAWLTDEGRAVWQLAAPSLRQAGMLLPSHETAFARYCDHVARWRKLRDKVEAGGETYETASKHGKLQRINPDLNAMLQIEGKIEALEDRFALTPLMHWKLREIRQRVDGSSPAPIGFTLPLDDADDENGANTAAANSPAASPFGILN